MTDRVEIAWGLARIAWAMSKLVLRPPYVSMVAVPGGQLLGTFRMSRWHMARLWLDVLGMVRVEVLP